MNMGDESLLHALYYGKIHPEAEPLPLTDEQREAQKAQTRREAALLSKLEGPLRAELMQLLEEANALSCDQIEAACIQGMRLGAKMAVELLNGP